MHTGSIMKRATLAGVKHAEHIRNQPVRSATDPAAWKHKMNF